MIQQIKEIYRDTFRLLKANLKPVIWYTVVCFAGISIVLGALTYYSFTAVLKLTGYTYMGNNTIWKMLLSPVTWIFLLLLCLFSLAAEMIEQAGYIHAFEMSRRGIVTNISSMLKKGLDCAWRAIRKPHNWMLAVFLLLTSALQSTAKAANAGFTINIPGFIMQAITGNRLFLTAYLAAVTAVTLLLLNRLFTVHIFVVEEKDFYDAWTASRNKAAKHYGRIILTELIFWGIFAAAIAAVLAAGAGIIFLVVRLLNIEDPENIIVIAVLILCIFCYILLMLLIPPFRNALRSALYYRICGTAGAEKKEPDNRKLAPRAVWIIASVVCLGLIANLGSVIFDSRLADTIQHKPEIAAHRGSSLRAPENTMPAFQLAIEENADWIELDVVQARDGTLIVAHDDSLKHVTGEDLCIHELTYDELMQRDVGSRFSKEFQGLRFSTLDEVLKLCKGKIAVQIELKPNGNEKDMEQAVLDVIAANDMQMETVVISGKDYALQKVKELSPETQTVYVMYVCIGDVAGIEYADHFSIEEQSVTREQVASMHAAGKRCYAWTINDPESVQNLVDCGIDCILTDDPVLMREAVDDADYSRGFTAWIRSLLKSVG